MHIQTGIGTQQGVMQQPPEIVTTKDLSYIQDALSWELLAARNSRCMPKWHRSRELRISVTV